MHDRSRVPRRGLRCRALLRRSRDRGDVDLVRRTATSLRTDPARARTAGLVHDEDTAALAALLDVLASRLPHLDPAVRRDVVASCRAVLDEE
jgi:hypothetical protein